MARTSASPAALHAQLNATTSSSNKLLILLNAHVAGERRPLRALLKPGTTNNFVRAESLSLLPSQIQVREQAGEMAIKYVDDVPRSLPRRSVTFANEFDDFKSSDTFIVVELSGSFYCIFGVPWLARHSLDVDWLNRTLQPRDIDVSAVPASLKAS